MEDLLKHTDIVIIGRPVGEKGIINTAREVSDLSKTAADMFSIGQVYEVEVIRYIKGEGKQLVCSPTSRNGVSRHPRVISKRD